MNTDQQGRLELVGQVASGIAHDLNNQMMLILCHVQFALDQVPEQGTLYQDLSDVRRAAERCTEMVDSLLSFGKPSRLELRPVDVKELLAETGRLLRRAIPAEVDLVIAADPGVFGIDADATQMQQVVINLAMNARDAMPSGGTLNIHGANAGDQMVLTVSDTGCGMTPEVQQHLFEPYFTTKQDCDGSGLGLVMVATIVKRHGGRISVESTPGHGSCFRILFPRSKSSAE